MAMNTTPDTSTVNKGLMIILIVAIIAVVGIGVIYLTQDHRTAGERVGDAVETLPKGLGKAADKLGDQPPAKNVERNLDDAAKKVK